MKTIEDMIAVMTAYDQGEKIECRKISFGVRWEDTIAPVWDWNNYDYRIKSKPHYRPYANAEECFADVKKHGGWIISGGNQYRFITGIGYGCNSDIVEMDGGIWMIFGELLQAVWADDGSPCGVKEE